jgi:hypothetical protein
MNPYSQSGVENKIYILFWAPIKLRVTLPEWLQKTKIKNPLRTSPCLLREYKLRKTFAIAIKSGFAFLIALSSNCNIISRKRRNENKEAKEFPYFLKHATARIS